MQNRLLTVRLRIVTPSLVVPRWLSGDSSGSVNRHTGGSSPSRGSRFADEAHMDERILGKDEAVGSNPIIGSSFVRKKLVWGKR